MTSTEIILAGVIIFLAVLEIIQFVVFFRLIQELTSKILAGTPDKYTQIVGMNKQRATPQPKTPTVNGAKAGILDGYPDDPSNEEIDTMFPDRTAS